MKVVVGLMLCGVMIFCLLTPQSAARSVLDAEWRESIRLFGDVPALLTNQIVSVLDVQNTLGQWLNTGNAANSLDLKIARWLAERFLVVETVTYVFVLRSMETLAALAIFLPAAGISVACGVMQRQARKARFFFTSPYAMAKRVQVFKLALTVLVVVVCLPMTLPSIALPLIVGLLALLCGWLVSGLQKEI